MLPRHVIQASDTRDRVFADRRRRVGTERRLATAVVNAECAHGASGLLMWAITENKAARAFYEAFGAELLVEQRFQWDGWIWWRQATAGAISMR